jgi:hypothetical protein
LLVLASDKNIYKIELEELNFENRNVIFFKSDDLEELKINLQKKFKIANFDLLDCQNRLVLYIQDTEKQNIWQSPYYVECKLFDLSERIYHPLLLKANGNSIYETTASNFDGSLIFSVNFEKSNDPESNEMEFKLIANYFKEDNFEKKHKFEINGSFKCPEVKFKDDFEFESNITSMCYLYKKSDFENDLLVVAEHNGLISLFEVEIKEKKKKKEISLRNISEYNSLNIPFSENDDDMILNFDYADQIIKSFDHKYIIIRTALSKIIILEIDAEKNFIEKIIIEKKFPFCDMSLSLNGRYLTTGGIFLESIIKFDLSGFDKESFKIDFNACFELNKENSEFGEVEETEDIFDDFKKLKFGKGYEKWLKYLVKKKNRYEKEGMEKVDYNNMNKRRN